MNVVLIETYCCMQAMAEMMSNIRGNKVSFDPNNLVLTAGATSANEALIFCLADPDDAILLPTPYYPGYALCIFIFISYSN